VEPLERSGKSLKEATMTITSDQAISDQVSAHGLPAQFADFDRFAAWIIETQDGRYDHRLASSMEEMQALYDTMMPRLGDVIEYINQYSLDDLPEHVHNLMLLTYSLIQASFAVEAWKQPRVPDSGAAYIACVREPRV
jgi:hypothetical protein